MKEYYQYKSWYQETKDKLERKYKEDFKLVAGLISSTSPRYSIKRNIKTALKVYHAFKSNPILFLQYIESHKAEFIAVYQLLPCHYNNILKCLKHDFRNDLILGGDKVNSFYQNITGNKKAVTIDTWMLRYFNHNTAWVNKGDYKKYSDIITHLSIKEGLEPCELQAVIWTKVRADYGFKPLSFAKFI